MLDLIYQVQPDCHVNFRTGSGTHQVRQQSANFARAMAADFSYDRERVAWADIKSGRHQLSRQDVVIVDRAKYAGNIGLGLR